MRVADAKLLVAKAVVMAGGVAALADYLHISERVLQTYIEGTNVLPDNLFLALVDIVLQQLP